MLVVAAPAYADAKRPPSMTDRIVAVVNDSVILSSELDLRMRPFLDNVAGISDPGERARRASKLQSQMLDEMIADELIVQAAKAARVDVDDSEVRAAMDYIKEQNHLDDKQLAEAMASQGMTKETYRLDLLRQRAINQILGAKLKIGDDDLQARYKEIERRAEKVSAVELAHIQIKLPAHPTEQQKDEAVAKGNAAMTRLKGGDKFADVAKDVSDDNTTNQTGGELGWIQLGTLPPEWDKVVFSMDKGDLRGPIVNETGIELFYAIDTKRTPLQPYSAMKKKLAEDLEREELAKLRSTWIDSLRKKAYVDIKL
jgi:peptidyl-prolyl cis-trans isomerase SurA